MAAMPCTITHMGVNEKITTKVYRETLRKLKAAAALRGEHMIDLVARLADEEYRRAREADEATKQTGARDDSER